MPTLPLVFRPVTRNTLIFLFGFTCPFSKAEIFKHLAEFSAKIIWKRGSLRNRKNLHKLQAPNSDQLSFIESDYEGMDGV